MNRTKRGEVYQLPNNKFTFVCVHCSNEFQHFGEFTLHVQTHLELDIKPFTLQPFPIDSDDNSSSKQIGQLTSNDIKVFQESDDDVTNQTGCEYDVEWSTSENGDCPRNRKSTVEKKFECFVCHKKLATRFGVQRHLMKVHRHDDLKCKYCKTKFRTSRYFERHNCMAHPDRSKFVSQMPIVEPIEPVRSYECAVCKRVFRDRRQLQSHLAKHKQTPCLCLICGKLFSGDRTLGRHMKLHDATSESHPCKECNKKFKQRRYLLDHNRKVHNLFVDDGPSICETCNQQFPNKRQLHIHMQTHPIVKVRKFPCTMCNHSAKCAYDLRRHIETHSIENRSFECPICHRKLLPRYANDHMRSHDNTRSFECNECGAQFKRAKTLKRHQNTHRTTVENKSTFKCDVCSTVFARMDGLLRHRRRHSVPMNYHCRVCNKGFLEQKSFLFHEANHTKGL